MSIASSIDEEKRQGRVTTIVTAYPVGVLLMSVALNIFVLGVNPLVASSPSTWSIRALAIAGLLLVVNHTWLMTATELVRGRFKLYATPEEWVSYRASPEDASREGIRELQRHHNAHRNTTENTVYFSVLAFAFVLNSPPPVAALVWLVGFGVARLGYTYGYLARRDGVRGLFMTLGLLSMYGMSSYLVLSLWG